MDAAAATHRDESTPRFRWTVFPGAAGDHADDGADVIAGLTARPKTLPPRYFYDVRGSELFERITRLDAYYPTRTEESILAARAGEIARLVGPCDLVELGSGSARKTRALLEALGGGDGGLRFSPVDVSAGILKASSRALLESFPGLEIWGLIGTYDQALAGLPAPARPTRLVIFLGSTIGNLTEEECAAFLARVRAALAAGDHFLVGFDLRKDPAVIEAAYNDPEGVTAQFNLNMLRHLNGRFGGDFDLSRFAHRAFYDRERHRIEMHLDSAEDQRVRLAALDLSVHFEAGESVRTEISRKFDLDETAETFAAAGFERVRAWTDPRAWFGVVLFRAR